MKYFIFFITVATCTDGIKNANETGVDCGGWCDPEKKCADLMGCLSSDDCQSGVCRLNICQGE
jgi:hypothetical protein